MTLSPLASWLFLTALAVGTITLIVFMVRLEQKSSRRFWSQHAQHDDPHFIERRNAVYRRMHTNGTQIPRKKDQ